MCIERGRLAQQQLFPHIIRDVKQTPNTQFLSRVARQCPESAEGWLAEIYGDWNVRVINFQQKTEISTDTFYLPCFKSEVTYQHMQQSLSFLKNYPASRWWGSGGQWETGIPHPTPPNEWNPTKVPSYKQ